MSAPSNIEKAFNSRGFVRIPSSDDGNCFYYTLSNWMKLFDYPLKDKEGKIVSNNHINLRKMVVDHMNELHADNPFIFAEYFPDFTPAGKPKYKTEESKHRYIKGAITQLRKNGLWDSILSDHIPGMAAQTFNLHITLYDWNDDMKDFVVHEINEGGDSHLDILRDTNHFELLIPKGEFTNAIKARLGNIEGANSGNEGTNTSKKHMAAPTKTRKARSKSRSPSRSPNTRNQARFSKMLGRDVTRNELATLRMLEEENMLTNSLRAMNNLNKSKKKHKGKK